MNVNSIDPEDLQAILLKKNPWAEDYIYYYIHIIWTKRSNIIPVLNRISEEDRHSFTREKGYAYLRDYQMEELGFATIIPTCNRPDAIKYLLNITAWLHRQHGVDIIIYDSSDNDDTKKVVQGFIDLEYYNVRYERYTGKFDGFSLDDKIIAAYERFCEEYKYIWMCRDGLIPILSEFYDKIRYYANRNVGCFIIDTLSRVDGLRIEKTYSTKEDCELLFKEQALRLQTLGMLIFSSQFAKKLIQTEPISEKNYSLWQMAAPFHAFARDPFEIVYFTANVYAPNIFSSKRHFWSSAEKLLRQWAVRWYEVVMNMPDAYSAVKDDCLMVYTVDFHPFTYKAVLEMRAYGGFNRKVLKKYKAYIPRVTRTPLWFFKLSASTPKFMARWGVKILENCLGRVAKLKKLLKRLLIREEEK